MKRSVFIVLLTLIAYSSYAQGKVDSIARVRKPVLLYLLERDKLATSLQAEVKLIPPLEEKISLLQRDLAQSKKDSTYQAGLIKVADDSAKGWKDTAEKTEVACNQEVNKQKYKKWIAYGIATLFGILAVTK